MKKDIIQEEIDKQSSEFSISPDKLKNFLNELFIFNSSSLLKNLGSQDEILNDKDALPDEFWEEIIENINSSYNENEKEWEEELKKMKLKIICFKFFSKTDLIDLEKVEKSLKLKIKKYFSSLQNSVSPENFRERFFNLPFEILSNFTRYILNSSKELNKKISLDNEEVKDKIKELKKERIKIIDKISFISNGNITVLDLTKIKELFDNGVFYEDNLLNRGINEYIFKLLNHNTATEKIIELFNGVFISDLIEKIETSPSYIQHISSIKNDETGEYFSEGGQQIGRRFDNEIDIVKKKDFSDSIIDDKSIFGEPKGRIKSTEFSWGGSENPIGPEQGNTSDSSGTTGGGFGGGSGGGGSFGGGGGFETGGDETVDLPDATAPDGSAPVSDGTPMPTGSNDLPVDFGTEETNSPSTTDSEQSTDQEPNEKK